MNETAKKITTTSDLSNVIPFPNSFADSRTANPLADLEVDSFTNPQLIEQLKVEIMSAISKAFYSTLVSQYVGDDNPFDAIYLSKLEPDVVPQSVKKEILQYQNIQDLSDTIEFADGWDD